MAAPFNLSWQTGLPRHNPNPANSTEPHPAIPRQPQPPNGVLPPSQDAVYKGCTSDAHRMNNGKFDVLLMSIRCTPLVHGQEAAMDDGGMIEVKSKPVLDAAYGAGKRKVSNNWTGRHGLKKPRSALCLAPARSQRVALGWSGQTATGAPGAFEHNRPRGTDFGGTATRLTQGFRHRAMEGGGHRHLEAASGEG